MTTTLLAIAVVLLALVVLRLIGLALGLLLRLLLVLLLVCGLWLLLTPSPRSAPPSQPPPSQSSPSQASRPFPWLAGAARGAVVHGAQLSAFVAPVAAAMPATPRPGPGAPVLPRELPAV